MGKFNGHLLTWASSAVAMLVALLVTLFILWQGASSVLLGGADSGWLIRTGEYIASHHQLPASDLFSWTSNQRSFICYQWLFELFQFALFKMGGLSAVGSAAYVFVSVLFLYFLPRTWISLGVRSVLIPIFLALVLTPFWFFARPQLATYALVFIFIQILEKWRKVDSAEGTDSRARNLIYLLPLLTVLWTNLHCTASLGILLIGTYVADSLLGQVLHPNSTEKKHLRASGQLSLVLLLSLAAVFVTPIDPPALFATLQSLAHTDMESCNELKPLFVTSYLWSLSNLYVLAATIILVIARRRVPRVGLLIALPALLGGLCVARLQPVGVILSWPFVGMALASLKPQTLKLPQEILWMVAAVALSLGIWFAHYPTQDAATGAFLGRPAALQFAAKHLHSGDRVFNDTLSGSRLIYLNGPPVFIDSRLFFYDPEFYKEWLAAMNLQISWATFANKFGINSAVLTSGYPLYTELLHSPDWLLCIDDGGTSFWLKDDAGNRSRLHQWGVDPDRGETMGLAGEMLANHITSVAAKHFENASAYYKQGKLQDARKEAEVSKHLVKSEKVVKLLAEINHCRIK